MIKCCKGCVPPKRSETCHATCPEYLAERSAQDAENAEIRKKRDLRYGLDCERIRAIKKTKREGRSSERRKQ